MPGAILLLILVVALRSWAQLGFMTFLPFYYVDYLKADPHSVGMPLFVFLGAGVLGTVIGGPLADRWGTRRFMLRGFLLAGPLGMLFLLSKGPWALLWLGLFGGVLISTFTITVVLGQSYLPGNTGLASGLIVGFAIGTGGVAVTLLGWIADHFGLLVVLWIAALMPSGLFCGHGLSCPLRMANTDRPGGNHEDAIVLWIPRRRAQATIGKVPWHSRHLCPVRLHEFQHRLYPPVAFAISRSGAAAPRSACRQFAPRRCCCAW